VKKFVIVVVFETGKTKLKKKTNHQKIEYKTFIYNLLFFRKEKKKETKNFKY
jgi:hypothetical protein